VSESPDEVMVIAGQRGGKSTFLGGVATKIKQAQRSRATGLNSLRDIFNFSTDDLVGNYQVSYGDEDEFEKEVVDRMRSTYEYPQATDQRDTYIVEFNLNAGQDISKTITVAAMDIPGEAQERAVQTLLSGDVDRYEVREKYHTDGVDPRRGAIKNRIEDSKSINNKEWKWAFMYHYLRSNRVIFMYNLHKIIHIDDIDPIIDPDLLHKVDNDDKTAVLLFTAADVLDYDPTNFNISLLSRGGINKRYFDNDLVNEIDTQLAGSKGDEILDIVKCAKDCNMDLFSIAVPEQQRKEIKHSQGKIVLEGFDNIGRWLKNTT